MRECEDCQTVENVKETVCPLKWVLSNSSTQCVLCKDCYMLHCRAALYEKEHMERVKALDKR